MEEIKCNCGFSNHPDQLVTFGDYTEQDDIKGFYIALGCLSCGKELKKGFINADVFTDIEDDLPF